MQKVDLDRIRPNPWQTRLTEDPNHVAQIAASITANREKGLGIEGLLQPAMGRAVDGFVELAYGMTRLAAWKIANPGLPFPVEIQMISDVDMSSLAAEENAARKDLDAIETATAIHRRIAEFHMTPLDAAAPFGIQTTAAVTNLLGLLALPPAVHAGIRAGQINQATARRLRTVQRIASADLPRVLEAALSEEPGQREQTVKEELATILDEHGATLNGVPWDLTYPKSPLSVESVVNQPRGPTALAVMEAFGETEIHAVHLGACHGCAEHVQVNFEHYCANPICRDLKARVFSAATARKLSKTLQIAVADDTEKVTRCLEGWQGHPDRDRALKSKPMCALLRLIPLNKPTVDHAAAVTLEEGVGVVALGTVDPAGLMARLHPDEKESTQDKSTESKAALEKRASERLAQSVRAHSREAAEVDRLRAAATKALAPTITPSPLLRLLLNNADFPDFGAYLSDCSRLSYDRRLPAQLTATQVQQRVMAAVIVANTLDWDTTSAKVRAEIDQIARQLKAKLPKQWDAVETTPHLKQGGHCWTCGASHMQYGTDGDGLSQVDSERGWTVDGTGKNVKDIRCPECNAGAPQEPGNAKSESVRAKGGKKTR